MKKTLMTVATIMMFMITLGSVAAFPSFFEKGFDFFNLNLVLNPEPDLKPESQDFLFPGFVMNQIKNTLMIKNDYVVNDYVVFPEKNPILTTLNLRYEINLWNNPDPSIYGSPLSKKQHLKSNGFLILDRSELGNPRYIEIEVRRPPWITDHVAVYKDAVTINGIHAKNFDTDGHQIKKGYWIRPGSTFGRWYFDMNDICGDTLFIDFQLLTATTYDGVGVDTVVFADIKILEGPNPQLLEPIRNCEPLRPPPPRCYIKCVKIMDGRIMDEKIYTYDCMDKTEEILEKETISTQEPEQKLSPEEMRKIHVLSAHDSPTPPPSPPPL